jgi:hypothetical protein
LTGRRQPSTNRAKMAKKRVVAGQQEPRTGTAFEQRLWKVGDHRAAVLGMITR